MTNVDTLPASDTTLVVRRTYNAPRERVFEAWLDPKALRRFMAPDGVTCGEISIDARVGGSYFITMNAPDGEMIVRGKYVEIRKPERISFTWGWDEDDPSLKHESQVTLDFHERGSQTELVLTHERLRDSESRDRHQNGWTSILGILDRAVAAHPFAIKGMDLSGFMVKDAPRAIAFYRNVLGLEPTMLYSEDRGAEYELPDGTTFGLWGAGGPVPFQPSNGILFAVDDLDAVKAALTAREVPVVMEFDLPGCRMLGIADTEGNTIVLHERKGA